MRGEAGIGARAVGRVVMRAWQIAGRGLVGRFHSALDRRIGGVLGDDTARRDCPGAVLADCDLKPDFDKRTR